MLSVWRSFLSMFDLKFGFLTPKYPHGQVLTSVEVISYVKNVKHDFFNQKFIDPKKAIHAKNSLGGTSPKKVKAAIIAAKKTVSS